MAVNVLAGLTGSASGGMSIALNTLEATYVTLANEAGVSLDLMHRVTSVATGGLDTLPHNGAVITLLAITGLGHREAYNDSGRGGQSVQGRAERGHGDPRPHISPGEPEQ